TFFLARLAKKCQTQDSRGQNSCRVGESISGTWMSQNLSRGSGTLGVLDVSFRDDESRQR
ncbi:MAG: hypothetical protein K0U52_11045, partial [Gammaproteobacteria bacterium]|nr:hypothetical protein [Gammaproteobacteria bacterium]